MLTQGSVYPLLDLDSGLNAHLSGRRNVVQRLEFLGASRREALDAVDEIAHFAGVQDAIDDAVRTYSSGMKVRLAFSIATSIRPDVFLLDEILAVGDEFFSERSFERIREIADGGRVTLVASHDWNLTFRLCTRIVWLEDGRIRADGTPHEIFDEYLAYLNAFELTKQVEIERVEICGDDGKERREFESGEPLRLRLWYRATEPAAFTLTAGILERYTGQTVVASWSGDDSFVVPAATAWLGRDPLPGAPLRRRRLLPLRRTRRARAGSMADESLRHVGPVLRARHRDQGPRASAGRTPGSACRLDDRGGVRLTERAIEVRDVHKSYGTAALNGSSAGPRLAAALRATSTLCEESRSTSPRARCSDSSAATAPARARCCA